jgi:hypothetical protein
LRSGKWYPPRYILGIEDTLSSLRELYMIDIEDEWQYSAEYKISNDLKRQMTYRLNEQIRKEDRSIGEYAVFGVEENRGSIFN